MGGSQTLPFSLRNYQLELAPCPRKCPPAGMNERVVGSSEPATNSTSATKSIPIRAFIASSRFKYSTLVVQSQVLIWLFHDLIDRPVEFVAGKFGCL